MNKKIGGVLHIQEHERLASHFCMQFDMVPELNVNAYGWVLYFNTCNADSYGCLVLLIIVDVWALYS
jgi:hypothetical protein